MSGFSPLVTSKGVLPCAYLDILTVKCPVSQAHGSPKYQTEYGAFVLDFIQYHFSLRAFDICPDFARPARGRDLIFDEIIL